MRAPDPQDTSSPAEFIALLAALREWSGLTYRELTARADAQGDVLPRSTVANMLARGTLPREDLVAAYVRACGCGPGEVDAWLAVRKELAVRGRREPADTADAEVPAEPDPAAPPVRRRPRRGLLAAGAAVVALAVAGVVVVLMAQGSDDRTEPNEAPKAQPKVAAPASGPVHLKLLHSGLCLSEKLGQQSGRIYQTACTRTTLPAYSLERLPGDTWRIATDHPDYGPGCTGVRDGSTAVAATLEDRDCGKRGPAEAFRIEAFGTPVQGYRVRPVHTDLCLGVRDGSRQRWAEVTQLSCTGDAKGQLFSFVRS
ncbi:helix-turn-helix transcriptional regulator [Streptomyces sp. NBC_01465]|uniref:helix-turn-helix transcriptional regulator n=1 Tax=Streptomyces sp. NBC_01465 TaxID=2903878 RepID=UPI002E30E8CC|nr:helix-turn-helix transcriptional regulator [Streptomyces sp. NBC_01465]